MSSSSGVLIAVPVWILCVSLVLAGIFFLARWRFYAKGYKKNYTAAVTAKCIGIKRTVFNIPILVYEANVDGMAATLYELPAIGAPALRPDPGDKVKLYIHPDPERIRTVMFTERSRPFVNEMTAPFNSLFFKLMGIGFIAAACVIYKLSTMM